MPPLTAPVEATGDDPWPLLNAAHQDFDRAIREDPEGPQDYGGRGTSRRHGATYLMRHGNDPNPSLDAAIDDLSRALALDPSNVVIRVARDRAFALRAFARMRTGGDAAEALDAARADYDRASSSGHSLRRSSGARISARCVRTC